MDDLLNMLQRVKKEVQSQDTLLVFGPSNPWISVEGRKRYIRSLIDLENSMASIRNLYELIGAK